MPSAAAHESTPPTSPQSASKRCRYCGHDLPETAFRLVRRDGTRRRHQCNQCHSKRESLRARRRRAEDVARFGAVLARTPEHRQLMALVEGMIEKAGGAERLVDAWHGQLQIAGRERPGSRSALLSYLGLARLLEAVVRLEREREVRIAERLEELSDQELETLTGMQIGAAAGEAPWAPGAR